MAEIPALEPDDDTEQVEVAPDVEPASYLSFADLAPTPLYAGGPT